MSRYALYFSPEPDSRWWQAGCHWLGRHPDTNELCVQADVAGIPPAIFHAYTSNARRYGFHATLKAPFRLIDAYDEVHLAAVLQAFCRTQKTIVVPDPTVMALGDFLALRPAQESREINALAMRCVSYFDFMRASPTDAELIKRRSQQLTTRQEQLLRRWGYPYTEEEYRFHLTITDSLNGVEPNSVYHLRRAAEDFFHLPAPLVLNGISLFKEDAPGADFRLLQRFGFGEESQPHQLPAQGRLFYLVGPAGCGKDSLLNWVRAHLPGDHVLRVVQRTITRAAHANEDHEYVAPEDFWQLAADGHFAMSWQSHELCYGIRRGFEAWLKAGQDVLVNGSREYVPQLLQQFPQAQVIWLEAEAEILHQRLRQRPRDNEAALFKRIARIQQFQAPEDPKVLRLDNSGSVDIAGQRLLDLLLS